jgi:hypothetical protein
LLIHSHGREPSFRLARRFSPSQEEKGNFPWQEKLVAPLIATHVVD